MKTLEDQKKQAQEYNQEAMIESLKDWLTIVIEQDKSYTERERSLVELNEELTEYLEGF